MASETQGEKIENQLVRRGLGVPRERRTPRRSGLDALCPGGWTDSVTSVTSPTCRL